MSPLRRLHAALRKALDSSFQQGASGEELILRRLRAKLDDLRVGARRVARVCATSFVVFAALTIATAVFQLDVAIRVACTSALALLLAGAGFGAAEALRVITMIDSLEELLVGGATLRPLDVVAAFRAQIEGEALFAPRWRPLVEELSGVYDTPGEARDILQRAGIHSGHIDFEQAMVPLWRDALRVADRQQKLPDLVNAVLADPNVRLYHERIESLARQILGEERRQAHN